MLTPAPNAAAALEARVKSLNLQVQLKRFELDTVLSVAQGVVNETYSVAELCHLFALTLNGQPHIGRVLMFLPDAAGHYCAVVQTPLRRDSAPRPDLALPAPVLALADPQLRHLAELGLGPGWWEDYAHVVPVQRLGSTVAYVCVGGLLPTAVLTDVELLLRSLALTLVGALENRRLTEQRVAAAAAAREIEIAQAVQRLLFPQTLPDDAHLALASSYVPHSEMGGDFYDVVAMDDDRLLLCVADVSGKGVPASLLMSNFQAGLRTLLRTDADLATVTHELNHLLFQSSGGEKFITAFLGIYDRRTRHLQFVNAGHNNGLLLPPTGPALLLRDGTVMLGIMPKLPKLEVGEVAVPPGSLLFLYTDGLTEVFDADQNEYGEERAIDFIRQHQQRAAHQPLATLHEDLLAEIKAFSADNGRFADDVTLLSCRFK